MPGLVRKLAILAYGDGLVILPRGPAEHHHPPVHIAYDTKKVSKWQGAEDDVLRDSRQLESYGVIGLITIASLSFLIAITRREQVAQIFGKPIYVVTDVALLPLSSKSEADEAILAVRAPADREQSDSEISESEDDRHSRTATTHASSPTEEELPFTHGGTRDRNTTSIAEDVAKRKGSYGKFASQWFSRQLWGSEKPQRPGNDPSETSSAAARANGETRRETAEKQTVTNDPADLANASTRSLLPKILRSAKMILSSRSFYFAYEFDLTRQLQQQGRRTQPTTCDSAESMYFWNRRMGSAFFDAGQDPFLVPIVQGFVGQRVFSVKPEASSNRTVNEQAPGNTVQDVGTEPGDIQKAGSYLLTLISRRSVKRSGLRYLRRGIDDEGHCANFVETEQILSSTTWDRSSKIRSFTQIRGSIPLYFSQSAYSFKPVPMLHNSPSANRVAFKRHFEQLRDKYGSVQIAVLVDKHGTEVTIGEAYENLYRQLHDEGQMNNTSFEWFDFHAKCRGMKFENVKILVEELESNLKAWGQTVIVDGAVQKKQDGIIRTNCMDCLDRTNVAQSAFGQFVLQKDIREDGFDIDLIHDETTNWFNTLWADNGDAISRQYASTAALKGDFTRTRKRDWRGQVNDLGLTLSRYYSNMVNDYFSQAVIDVLLGNVSWKIFEDFESTMMSADPGISVESAREAAIENCAKIVIQGTNEDLIHGWTMLTPAQENTLRALPFEESVVLLTDAAVYCCKFDWNTEKVASFEKVDLGFISKIRFGTYITSTFTDRQLDERLNQGLVIVFTPGTGSLIRVNTRSLQNSVSTESSPDGASLDGGTGILSWFAHRSSSPHPRTLALKVVSRDLPVGSEQDEARWRNETPNALARRISSEMERAIVANKHEAGHTVVEEGDIINAAEARRRTGYLEQLGHSIKKMVWT